MEKYTGSGELCYKITYKNGYGKGFDTNGNLIFEGECQFGKKNGKGKEYNSNGELIFEGEYKNSLRWKGKGKELDCEGRIFEGIYEDGDKWDSQCLTLNESMKKEILYNDSKFTIEYKEGKIWNGNVNEYCKGKLIFEGEYKKGIKWKGKLKEYDSIYEVILFDGEIELGEKHGIAIEHDYMKNLIFEGEYKYGQRWNGPYKEYNEYNNNLSSEGKYIEGKKCIEHKYDWSGMTTYNALFDSQ